MNQPKVVKVFLAAGAFFGGLVVAQQLQPMPARHGDLLEFQDTLLVAQAAAETPTVIEVSGSDTPLTRQRFESPPRSAEMRTASLIPETVKTPAHDPELVEATHRDDVEFLHGDDLELLHSPAPVRRPTIADLPNPAYQISRPLDLDVLPPQFAPTARPIARAAASNPAASPNQIQPGDVGRDEGTTARGGNNAADRAQIVESATSRAASRLAAAIDQILDEAQSVKPTQRVADARAAAHPDTTKRAAPNPDQAHEVVPNVDDTADDVHVRLSPELLKLKDRIAAALDLHRYRELNTQEKSAWSIMHSLIAYGVEKKVRVGSTGKRASAIGWICYNNPCRGVRLFYLDRGRIRGQLGPGNQGHEGQFLAMVAQSRVHPDYPMKVGGREFTISDLVNHEKMSCRDRTELTFKLIGLAHYLDVDHEWTNDLGEAWDIPRVIREEIRQPIVGAACGGTHRLFGLSYAVNRCIHKGHPVTGQFRRAQIYVKDYQDYTFRLQNKDGSFSTQYFAGRGATYDEARRLLTTGHIAEWLSFSLPREELTRPEMVKAMHYLSDLLVRNKDRNWEVGPLGHTLHALNLYNDRVFRNHPANAALAAQR